MEVVFEARDGLIPSVSPRGGMGARRHATTQLLLQVEGWHDNLFRMWAPEHVGNIWSQMNPATAHQAFETTADGVRWGHTAPDGASIDVTIDQRSRDAQPSRDDAVVSIAVRVTNGNSVPLDGVGVANCLQLAMAPDFACGDYSRIFARVRGAWLALAEMELSSDYPHLPAETRRESGGRMVWGGDLSELFEPTSVDHPLMVCVARDGARAVATASAQLDYLFHNRANPHLLCLHSTQQIVDGIQPGGEHTFVQRVYFTEGGIDGAVALFDALPPEGNEEGKRGLP